MKSLISGLLLATLLVSASGAQNATQKSVAEAPAQASQGSRSQTLAINVAGRSTPLAQWLYALRSNGAWFFGPYPPAIACPFSRYNRALFPELRLGDGTFLIDGPEIGEVKLSGAPETAAVFLDGAFAGNAGKLKNVWLAPGPHELSISAPDREPFHQRIYVLSGKELRVRATLKQRHQE